MGKRFDVIDHTADIGIVAYGRDLNDVFSNAAYGMFSLMIDLDKVQPRVCRECYLKAADCEMLLVTWLNELLYLFDTEYMIFKSFEVDIQSDNTLSAKCYGEKINSDVHELSRAIKAATYHTIGIMTDVNGSVARVIFDI